MPAFDSIINTEEWISDHYLTSDETKWTFLKRSGDRIRAWRDEEKEQGITSPETRLRTLRGELEVTLTSLGTIDTEESSTSTQQTEAAADLVHKAFGYGSPSTQHYLRAGEDLSLQAWKTPDGSLLVIDAEAMSTPEDLGQTKVTGEVTVVEKPTNDTAANVVSEVFLAEDPPAFIVVVAGAWVILTERESWALGRSLAVNLALAVERNDTKVTGELAQITTILAREDLEQQADGTTWWVTTIEDSRHHAVTVSAQLRTAVRESIEIIGNDVLDRDREQGLSTAEVDGAELGRQALRYLYRVLFLLFAESSPELEVLPVGTPEYDDGYGLDRIRELILTPPLHPREQRGTHLYDSLQLLFTMVSEGHNPTGSTEELIDASTEGLEFRSLEADLFKTDRTSIIDAVGLSNLALHNVLERLLLSSEEKGRDRGFISYATLGVTELGQVYEGLMSYTGFIAGEDLYEVAPRGNPEKGSWVVTESGLEDLPEDSLVRFEVDAPEGGTKLAPRIHRQGSFVFRQSSRDRERSASFYTPEVLTSFTVSQGIEVLREEGGITCAEDILNLRICEPAMGSGAFAVEAVRQLADLYLTLR